MRRADIIQIRHEILANLQSKFADLLADDVLIARIDAVAERTLQLIELEKHKRELMRGVQKLHSGVK